MPFLNVRMHNLIIKIIIKYIMQRTINFRIYMHNLINMHENIKIKLILTTLHIIMQ